MTTDGEITQSPAPTPEGPTAWVEFSARLGDIGRGVQQLVKDGRASRAEPLKVPLTRGADIPASGTVTIDLGVPGMGRQWTVKNLAVGPSAGVAGTLGGSANWYIGNPAAFGMGEWAAPTMATLPAFQLLGSDQAIVTPSNHLFVVITGATQGQSALARAFILDYPQYSGQTTIEL